MPAKILGITLHLQMAPGESCAEGDQALGTLIASGVGDPVTGLLDLPMSWQEYLQAFAGGHAGAVASPATVAPVAGAAGAAGAAGTLTQALPIAGEADAAGGGAAVPPSQAVPAGAGGTAGASGTLSGAGGPSAMEGAAAGHAGASAVPTVSVPLGGSAGGAAGAGPSTQAQDGPHLVGSAAGAGAGSGTVGTASGVTAASPVAGFPKSATAAFGSTSVQTAAFTTPSPVFLVAVLTFFEDSGSAGTITLSNTNTGETLSWGSPLASLRVGGLAPAKSAIVWKASSVGALASGYIKATAQNAGKMDGAQLTIYAFTGANALGTNAVAQGFIGATHPGITLECQAGSIVLLGMVDSLTEPDLSSNLTRDADWDDPDDVFRWSAGHLTTPTAASGNVTVGNMGAVTNAALVAYEVQGT